MTIPIITYHEIGEHSSPLFTSRDLFRTHLEAFAKLGYRSIDLTRLANLLRLPEPLPEDCMVLTFDDGYKSFLEQAYPLLNEYGYGATVYLVSDYCGVNDQWPRQRVSVPTSPHMSFDEVRSVMGDAIKIGCHTRSHSALTKVGELELEQEIIVSKQIIEKALGQTINDFAYPYGVTNERVTKLTRLHYKTAVTTQLGTSSKKSDLLLLPRIDSYYLNTALISRLPYSSTSLQFYALNFLRSIKRLFIKDY